LDITRPLKRIARENGLDENALTQTPLHGINRDILFVAMPPFAHSRRRPLIPQRIPPAQKQNLTPKNFLRPKSRCNYSHCANSINSRI
jgi:hypothetical protein